jgi:membrane peptidoglycan carboxypeptidase
MTRTALRGEIPPMTGMRCPYCGADQGEPAGVGWVPRGRGRWRRILRRLRRLLAVAIALGVLGTVMSGGLWLITPSVTDAPALARALAHARHAPYPGPPVPEQFAASLVATEDHRFYSEQGIDPFAIVRVAYGSLTGQPDQGGSTLYQQLARMLYTPGGSGVAAEAEQIILGVKLAFSYPRAEILRMYADVAYFGSGYYGLDEASCGYFGVPPARLSVPQAAVLAGVMPAPSIYDPVTHFASARAREAHVLSRLVATGALTRAQADRAYRQPLHPRHGRRAGCRAG